jgi:pimeloyl-ACP methyl ester carboxylesterase
MRVTLGTILAVLSIFAAGTGAAGERLVTTPHDGLTLNGRVVTADGKSARDGIVLFTHGTLAHNGMELVRAVQDGLRERGVNSLAITLGLGQDRRAGMYGCETPHRHKHEDALDEIGVWLDWLKAEGAGDVTLMGHSRGGNQTAWFAAERPNAAVKRVVLLAPSMWSAARRNAGYERRFNTPLTPILERAAAFVAKGGGGEMLKNTGFLFCPGAEVSAGTFLSYYKDEPRRHTPALLPRIAVPVLVIAGSLDTVVKGIPEAVRPLADGDKVTLVVVEDASHFFLDFFAEDVADAVAAFVAP